MTRGGAAAGRVARARAGLRKAPARRGPPGRAGPAGADGDRRLARRRVAEVDADVDVAEGAGGPPEGADAGPGAADGEAVAKSVSKTAKKVASTFAPRSSTARGKNPAVKGSALYAVFEAQAALSLVAGGLLAFNVVLPSDEPSITRLMGMWMCWILTVPSLRARDCEEREKDALNLLFLLIPIINVSIPIVWKSFAAVYTADVIALFAVYAWKMQWLPAPEESE